MKSTKQVRAAGAALAALALTASGVVLTPLAASAQGATEVAPTDDKGYQAFVQDLISEDSAVTAVSQDGTGNIVVSAVAGTLSSGTVATLETYENVVLKDRPVAQAYAIDDVVGGAGYAVNRASVCSFGFSGWSPTGAPAIITAGHCGPTGATIERTLPSEDDAPYFPGFEPRYTPAIMDSVGTMAFSQWGGPGGSEGGHGDLDSTDIAAIAVTNSDLRLRPLVTDWTSWESEDLSLSGTPITAVGTVQVGDQITRSGRSTGTTTGDVTGAPGAEVIEDKSWTRVCEVVTPVPTNCHWVYGFWTDADPRPGDSGGAYMRGTTAVGVLSGGGGGMSFATDLQNGLRLTGGYTVMLDLAEPIVTSDLAVAPNGVVHGTGPAGLTLRVTLGSSTTELPIAADGTWSFRAPTAEGPHAYDLAVIDDGFNVSDTVSTTITVDGDLVVQPLITAPANGAVVTRTNVTFTGLGAPSATITLSGAATGTATVDGNGAWSVTTTLGYGPATVTATQAIFDITATTSIDLSVIPVAPVLTSPAAGSTLTTAPTEITGTALPGATVVVTLDGKELEDVTFAAAAANARALAADASWSVAIPGVLAAGAHEITVVQTIDGVSSAALRASFTVAAPPAGGGGGGSTPGTLPATGMDLTSAAAPAAIGGALVLAAGALLLIARRRATRI